MTLRIAEWFGHSPLDTSPEAQDCRARKHCPFIDTPCTKTFSDKTISGVCSVHAGVNGLVPICPNRLYAENYAFLDRIAAIAFGGTPHVIKPGDLHTSEATKDRVVAFGKKFGSELKVPKRGGNGAYSVDWILAKVDGQEELLEFVAVEVQTIDTTGSYKPAVETLRQGDHATVTSEAGMNWENVNKRILPQLIYKGHLLRREPLCRSGLFFVCPTAVYKRIEDRLGGKMLPYKNLQPGSIVFHQYALSVEGPRLGLAYVGQFATTVDQVATAFTAPVNLPEAGVYETAIRNAIKRFG